MVNNSLKCAKYKSLFEHLRLLRIKVFTDHLCKITLIINTESFMTLGNTQCSQTFPKHTNAKLNML